MLINHHLKSAILTLLYCSSIQGTVQLTLPWCQAQLRRPTWRPRCGGRPVAGPRCHGHRLGVVISGWFAMVFPWIFQLISMVSRFSMVFQCCSSWFPWFSASFQQDLRCSWADAGNDGEWWRGIGPRSMMLNRKVRNFPTSSTAGSWIFKFFF